MAWSTPSAAAHVDRYASPAHFEAPYGDIGAGRASSGVGSGASLRAAGLQQVERPHDVDLAVAERIGDRDGHAGLCGEVKHGVRPDGVDDAVEGRRIRDVDHLERRPVGHPARRARGAAVAPHDPGAALEQRIDHMGSDKAGAAGHDRGRDLHACCPPEAARTLAWTR